MSHVASVATIPGQASKLGWLVVLLMCLLTWAVSHPYAGLFHDATLYCLQTLSHLRPDALPKDVFLKFGSQDHFSVFAYIYAEAARLLGLEESAALLTLFSQLAFVTVAWLVVRAVLPASLALMGVALVIAAPGYYGSQQVFNCVEGFLTPRLTSEALVLASVAAVLTKNKRLALPFIAAAALIHPIMALPGAAAIICIHCSRRDALRIATPAMIVALALSALPPAAHWGRLDSEWLALVENRTPYLFIDHWQLDDWSRLAVTLSTLWCAMHVLPALRAAALARSALIVCVGGVSLTWIGTDLLHGVAITQLQPWRGQWLATVLAELLLPATLCKLWGESVSGRTCVFLLSAAWIFGAGVEAALASAACVCALAFMSRLKSSEARWISFGSAGMLALALIWRLASNLEFTDAYYMEPSIPVWLRRATSFIHDGSLPMISMALVWWLAHWRTARPVLMAVGGLAVAACIAILPLSWARWTQVEFSASVLGKYSAIRAKLSPDGEIFWPASTLGTWVLLNRPSYISAIQTSGMIFSRPSAVDLQRRAEALRSAIDPSTFLQWEHSGGISLELTKPQLIAACGTGAFAYLVTSTDLGLDVLATATVSSGPASRPIRLYRCPPATIQASQARAAAAAT